MFDDMMDKFIEEPLMTEDGFVNPVCISQLESAIKNMGKTYERLADDVEWNTKKWIFKKFIVACFAKGAVDLSPDVWPKGLENVVRYLDACLEKSIEWDDGLAELSLCDINKFLYDVLYDQGIGDFDSWNDGVDFVDLDALLHNVCIQIRNERRIREAFDREFEEKYGSLDE